MIDSTTTTTASSDISNDNENIDTSNQSNELLYINRRSHNYVNFDDFFNEMTDSNSTDDFNSYEVSERVYAPEQSTNDLIDLIIYKLQKIKKFPKKDEKFPDIENINLKINNILDFLKYEKEKIIYSDFYILFITNRSILQTVCKIVGTDNDRYLSREGVSINYFISKVIDNTEDHNNFTFLYRLCNRKIQILFRVIQLFGNSSTYHDFMRGDLIDTYLATEKSFDILFHLFIECDMKLSKYFYRTVNRSLEFKVEMLHLQPIFTNSKKSTALLQIYLQKILRYETCKYFFEFPKSENRELFEKDFSFFDFQYKSVEEKILNYNKLFTAKHSETFSFLLQLFNSDLKSIFTFLQKHMYLTCALESTTEIFLTQFLRKYIEENYTAEFIGRVKHLFNKYVNEKDVDEYISRNCTYDGCLIVKKSIYSREDDFYIEIILKNQFPEKKKVEEFFRRVCLLHSYMKYDCSLIVLIDKIRFNFKNQSS